MTERKRATGFALMDSAFAADRKFVRLLRLAPNPRDYAAAVGVFWLVLADARRDRSPDIDWDEYDEFAEQVALLKEVKLLTSTGFDADTFQKWAPVYRSPWDEKWVRSGTERVRSTPEVVRENTDTSSLLISPHLPTNGKVAREENGSFIRMPDKSHHGQHPDCLVCHPAPVPTPKATA